MFRTKLSSFEQKDDVAASIADLGFGKLVIHKSSTSEVTSDSAEQHLVMYRHVE